MRRGERYPSAPLTRAEAASLVWVCGGGFSGPRNRALLVLLWRGGLRISEALTAELADLEVKRTEGADPTAQLVVRKPKGWDRGAPPRTVGLDAEATRVVLEWLGVRGLEPGLLLRTRTGAPVLTSYARALLPRLARRAGITRRVHPHCLRHTFARDLHDEGFSVREIQVALGHGSLATTESYLRSIGCVEVARQLRERRWDTG